MWNYYTKEINNQGYNIEFNDKKLVASILHSNSVLDGCDISFGIVDYGRRWADECEGSEPCGE